MVNYMCSKYISFGIRNSPSLLKGVILDDVSNLQSNLMHNFNKELSCHGLVRSVWSHYSSLCPVFKQSKVLRVLTQKYLGVPGRVESTNARIKTSLYCPFHSHKLGKKSLIHWITVSRVAKVFRVATSCSGAEMIGT